MRLKNLVLASMFLLIFASSAQTQVMIEQGKVVIRANPGETIVNTLPIHNTSETNPITLHAYWEDFMYVEPFNGDKEFTPAGTSEYSASRWVNFSPQEFTLEPKGSKIISYSLQVPANAKGGYYGTLFLEEGGSKSSSGIGVSIVTRIGALFFIETTDSTRTGKFQNLAYTDKEFTGDFASTANVILIPDATFYILDKEGLVAERGEIPKFYLAPGKTAKVKFKAAEKLGAGDYMAVLTFDFGAGDSVTHEFDFNKGADGSITITRIATEN